MAGVKDDYTDRVIAALWAIAADVKSIKSRLDGLEAAINARIAYDAAVISAMASGATAATEEPAEEKESGASGV